MGQHLAPAPAATPAPLEPLRLAEPLRRIGGGYETDVYRSDDGRHAVKFKQRAGSRAAMLARARLLAQVSQLFCAYLGPAHSMSSDYLLVADAEGLSHVVTIQPFLEGARALDAIDLSSFSAEERAGLVAQLRTVVVGALACYGSTGYLPDLYGLGAHASAQARNWDPRWLVHEGWRILTGRPLLTAHNLMLSADGRVILVDYDPICAGGPLCRVVYGARALLLARDLRQLAGLK